MVPNSNLIQSLSCFKVPLDPQTALRINTKIPNLSFNTWHSLALSCHPLPAHLLSQCLTPCCLLPGGHSPTPGLRDSCESLLKHQFKLSSTAPSHPLSGSVSFVLMHLPLRTTRHSCAGASPAPANHTSRAPLPAGPSAV